MSHPYSHLYKWSEHSLTLADAFREKLEAAGFTETRWSKQGKFYDPRNHLQFFRPDTVMTAFFVNLEPSMEGICVRYGLDSTAFTQFKGDEDSLLNWGIKSDDACLRWAVSVTTAEVPTAAEQIAVHFRQYQGTEKDDLLNIRKELRKVFLDKITDVLKPLGFRKKGAQWRKVLPSGHTIYFWAEKGSYGDGYDFSMALSAPPGDVCPRDWCLSVPLNLPDLRHPNPFIHHPFDWQVNTEEDLREILDNFLHHYHNPLFSGDTASLPLPLLCQKKECPREDCLLNKKFKTRIISSMNRNHSGGADA